MQGLVEYLSKLYEFTDALKVIMPLFTIYGVYAFVRDWMPRTVTLSIGTFSIKRKYFDVQNVTNVVSAKFYDGGQVPPNIRKEIIELTCPSIKIKK